MRSSLFREGRSRKSIEEIESLAPCRLLREGGMIISKTFSSSVWPCKDECDEISSIDVRLPWGVSSSFMRSETFSDFS